MRRYGTIVANVIASQSGDSPVKNWKGSGARDYPVPTHAGKLDPDEIIKHETRKYHCYACPLGCGGIVSYQDSKRQTREAHKPEYETCSAFGSLLLNKDPQLVFEINDLLNRAGIDTISTGGVVAFAIECAEHGLFTPEQLNGLKLEWGNADSILALVRKIIAREGIGDLLADGVRVAAQKIGKNAADFAIHAGGQELPMHDTRYDPGFALAYSLDPTPGRHNTYSIQWWELYGLHRLIPGLPKRKDMYFVKRKYEPRDKALLWTTTAKFVQVFNAAGGCLFGAQMDGRLKVFDYLNAAGGWDHPPEFYLQVGERIQFLRQAFNFKHGLQPRRDFLLPDRALGAPPLAAGPTKGVRLDVETLSRNFLREIGWDPETAKPTRARLAALGLTEVADEIGAE
jgi:aldehyde:ferredoxin oxidoreductase